VVYSKTITRFVADDKVVYQQVRWEMWLASDNSLARRHLKHLSWRSRWIILSTFEWGMPVSCKISRADRYLFSLSPDWARGPPLLCDEHSSADCQCFQVFNPCWQIHSADFMHYTF